MMTFNRFIRWMNLMLLFLSLSSFRSFTPYLDHFPNKKLVTSKDFSVEQLVKEVFIKGGCRNVSNIQAIGDLGGIGTFSQGQSSISIDNGVILSTGHIENAHGPNVNRNKSGDFADESGDKDLNILAEQKVEDAVGIEFDFVPIDTVINFNYVFASEEYCEFVGTKYNDVFGFFVSGPGIDGPFSNGAINVALIPGTNDYVSINSVNHLKNAGFYKGNELPEDAEACGFKHTPSGMEDYIQFDGFTTVLKVELKLIPCETYHIRLVVGDLGDNYFDSAVFLQAKSFSLGGDVRLEAFGAQDKEIAEGCSGSYFEFSRVDELGIEDDITVPFIISKESTASEQEDFTPLSRSIVIPAGSTSVKLPIEVLPDQNLEPDENLILELDYPCECITDTAFLVLKEPPPILIEASDEKVCPGDTIVLSPTISGGFGPYEYIWNNGDTNAQINLRPTEDLQIDLKVKDQCQQSAAKSFQLGLRDIPEIFMEGDQIICEGETTQVFATGTGDFPWTIQLMEPDSNIRTFEISSDMDNTIFFDVAKKGVYVIDSFSDGYCPGEIFGEGIVRFSEVDVDFLVQPPSCFGREDGMIEITKLDGNAPYTLDWFKNNESIEQIRLVGEGNYRLELQDGKGCTSSYNLEIIAPQPLGRMTYDCKATNFSYQMLSAQGGTPPYQYSIDGNRFAGNELFSSLQTGLVYNLNIKDANGCLIQQPFEMPNADKDFVKIDNNLIIKFGDKFRFNPQLSIDLTLVDSVSWIPANNLTCDDCLRPILTALNDDVYKLWVKDIFGCEDTAVVNILMKDDLKIFIPSAFSPDNNGINDRLTVYGKPSQIQKVLHFQIFDRWGNRLYEEKDFKPNNYIRGWDGRFKGKYVRSGVYVYNVLVRLIDDSVLELNGSVNVFR